MEVFALQVLTLQQYNDINACCPCQMPLCDVPQKEAESFNVFACGYTIGGSLTGINPLEVCIIYKQVDYTFSRVYHEDTFGFIGQEDITSTTDITENSGCTRVKYYNAHNCSEKIKKTNYHSQEVEKDLIEPVSTITTTIDSSSTETSGCSGTRTQTGKPPESYNSCPCAISTPDNKWTYTSPATFTYNRTRTGGVETIYEFTETIGETVKYSEPVVFQDLLNELNTFIFGTDVPNSDPVASHTVVGLSGCSQIESINKVRYRMGIPNTNGYANYDNAYADWQIQHSNWVSCEAITPGECGPEPQAPVRRTVYDLTWSEVFFPKLWEEWDIAMEAYEASVRAHDEWLVCKAIVPPIDCGEEPIVLANPGEEPTPKPSLVADREWSYGGTEPFSEWFEMAPPETPGQVRVVNMMAICYYPEKMGILPTSSGEIINIEV
jgi:hypothetical protein